MKKTDLLFADYLSDLTEEEQLVITSLDKQITEIFSTNHRQLWEGVFWGGTEQTIIGYGNTFYTNRSKQEVEWFTMGLAVQKNHYSLYINAVENNQYLAQSYKSQLGKVKVGSSSIAFKKLEDLNLPILKEIIQKSYQWWVKSSV